MHAFFFLFCQALTLNLTKHQTIYVRVLLCLEAPKPSRQYEFCMRFWLDSCCMLPDVRNARAILSLQLEGGSGTGRVMLSAVTFSCVCVSRYATATGITFINTPFWPYIEREREREKIRRNARVLARFLSKLKNNTNFAHFSLRLFTHTHHKIDEKRAKVKTN